MTQPPGPGLPGDTQRDLPPIDPTDAVPSPPPPPPPGFNPVYYTDPPRRSGVWPRVWTGLISSVLVFSILLNVYFGAFVRSLTSGPVETVYREGDKSNRIVIIPVDGLIDQDTARFVHDSLKQLRQNPPRAVVMRIDSEGGGVAASDQVWHDLVAFKQETQVPVVTSFGSIAASGGYYIAAPSQYIFAEPTTITGSIGVIAQAFTVEGLLDKIGVTPETIVASRSPRKDMLNPLRPWTDQDRRELRAILDQAYDRFVRIVAQGRGDQLTPEQVGRLATGQVYTTSEALANKLVDEEGYLGAAIDKAKELAGIDPSVEPAVTRMSPRRHFNPLGMVRGADPDPTMALSLSHGRVRRWLSELTTVQLQYRWVR